LRSERVPRSTPKPSRSGLPFAPPTLKCVSQHDRPSQATGAKSTVNTRRLRDTGAPETRAGRRAPPLAKESRITDSRGILTLSVQSTSHALGKNGGGGLLDAPGEGNALLLLVGEVDERMVRLAWNPSLVLCEPEQKVRIQPVQ
jgi:hypothetical protein